MEAEVADLVGADRYERTDERLVEQNDEWQLQRRYMQLEGLQSLTDSHAARLSAVIS